MSDNILLKQQINYLNEQIKFEHTSEISTAKKITGLLSLEKVLEEHYDAVLEGFDIYQFDDTPNGPVKHWLVIDKEGEYPTTQWVLTGFNKYTQIPYPSIYLGAGLFQHGDDIYMLSGNVIDTLTPVFAIHGQDERMVNAKLYSYIHHLTGHYPNYFYNIDKSISGDIYLTLNIQLSPPTYDNPWGEQANYVSSRICIQKQVNNWMYVVTTMNLPGTRHMFYDDASKDDSSENE